MLTASFTPFGGFREDAVNMLSSILGKDRVLSFINGLETEIRTQAEAGARQAIPDIEAEVRRTAKSAVTPLVVTAIAVGALGGVLGTWALLRTRKRSR